jgi:hypothetical protein
MSTLTLDAAAMALLLNALIERERLRLELQQAQTRIAELEAERRQS